ncbi:RNA polymerase II [Cryomyces antarcticus]
MQILEPMSKILTNFEVKSFLEEKRLEHAKQDEETKAAGRKVNPRPANYITVLNETESYLNASHQPSTSNPKYTPSMFTPLMERLGPYGLTKTECMSIVNLCPGDIVALDTIVEECDMRFTTEQQEEMVAVITEVLGRNEEGKSKGEGEGVEQEE